MTASVGLNPGHVLMTKDFGDSWTDQWIQKDIPILGCDVKGWTLVGTGGSIYHSIDKGMNWNSVPSGTLLNLNAVHFANNTMGYIVGDGGIIFITSDGGYSWQKQLSPTTQNLRCVRFTDPFHGFICGDSGVILTTTNGGYTEGVKDRNISEAYPIRSYPNPFSSKTKIDITLAQNGRIRLTIFNQLGIEVAKLAEGVFEAGAHSFEWNSDALASGVYICKLEADGKISAAQIVIEK